MIERGYYGRIAPRGEAPAAGWPDWTDMDTWAPRDFPPIAGGAPEGDGDGQQSDKVKAEADACVAKVDAAAAAYVEAFRVHDRAQAALQVAQHRLWKALAESDWIDPRPSLPIVVDGFVIDGGAKPGKRPGVRRILCAPVPPRPEPPPLYSVHFFGELPVGSRFTFAENSERFVYEKTGDRTFRFFDMPHLPYLPVWPIAGPDVAVVHLGSPEPCAASS